MAYSPTPTVENGGRVEAVVGDSEVAQLLSQILEQLKIMNSHLSVVTENTIEEAF